MQYKVLAASLLASASLSAAAPLEARQESCSITKTGDYVWELSNFSAHKPDGVTIASLQFDVRTTAGNLADFTCKSSSTVEESKWYKCESNSEVYFAFQNDRSGLIVRQVVEGVQSVATTTVLNTCRKGNGGNADFICEGTAPAYITLVQSPQIE